MLIYAALGFSVLFALHYRHQRSRWRSHARELRAALNTMAVDNATLRHALYTRSREAEIAELRRMMGEELK